MYTIEHDADNQSGPFQCGCCEQTSWTFWNFVSDPEGAYAVVFFALTVGHPHRHVAISIGGWGEGATTERRVAFFAIFPGESGLMRALETAEESPHGGKELLGRPITSDDDVTPFRDVLYAALEQDARMGEAFWTGDFGPGGAAR